MPLKGYPTPGFGRIGYLAKDNLPQARGWAEAEQDGAQSLFGRMIPPGTHTLLIALLPATRDQA